MSGDFEVDDLLHRHGKAIAKAIAPPKKFTWVQSTILYAIAFAILGALFYGVLHGDKFTATASEDYEKMARYYESTAAIFRALAAESKKNEEASKAKR